MLRTSKSWFGSRKMSHIFFPSKIYKPVLKANQLSFHAVGRMWVFCMSEMVNGNLSPSSAKFKNE
jgi:hypothetical protein